MPIPVSLLGGLSPEDFLREYWQKKPLLIRGALPGFVSPITPEELAGLALEEEAESRIILQTGGDHPWQLRHGPFAEEDFTALPETGWTLLVQEVDRWVPEVAALLDYFRFIPSWRIDDVMVSYAPDQGNVGAHIDNYDVFLLQGLGRREWHIGQTPVDEERLVPDLEVSILADFEADDVWTLEAGDMLYLPPRFAHHGIAIGDCMTYSIGFRAPSHEEMLAAFHTQALQLIDPNGRYSDPDLQPAQPDSYGAYPDDGGTYPGEGGANPGDGGASRDVSGEAGRDAVRPDAATAGGHRNHPAYISPRALEQARALIRQLYSEERVSRWFGALVTEPTRAELMIPPDEHIAPAELMEALEAGAVLHRVAPNRFAFMDGADGGFVLFVHGEEFALSPALAFAAPLLAGRTPLDAETLGAQLEDDAFVELLTHLVNEGYLEPA